MFHTDDVVKTVDYLLNLSPAVAIKEIALQCREKVIEHEQFDFGNVKFKI